MHMHFVTHVQNCGVKMLHLQYDVMFRDQKMAVFLFRAIMYSMVRIIAVCSESPESTVGIQVCPCLLSNETITYLRVSITLLNLSRLVFVTYKFIFGRENSP